MADEMNRYPSDPEYRQNSFDAASPSIGNPQNLSTSGMAVASLVLGIVGIATSFIPVFNNGSFVMGILGIIFAIVGLLGINKGRKKGKGLAIAGLVLSIVTIVAVLVTQSFYGAIIDNVQDELHNAGYSRQTAATASENAAASSNTAVSDGTNASKYSVTIDSASKTNDYQGNPAIVVTYTWSNNSDSEATFSVALRSQCFQNGVQLDSAVVSGLGWDSSKDVKPGATQTVQKAYSLVDDSPVTAEVEEMFSWGDEKLAEATFQMS